MRQDQWSVTLIVNGKNLGVWDTMAGGDIQFSETKYKKGGMQPEVSLGGTKSVNNVTLTRLLDGADDWETCTTLMAADTPSQCSVSRQPLDEDKNPFGRPLVESGKLLQVMPGDTDSNSEGAQIWSVVISTNSTVS